MIIRHYWAWESRGISRVLHTETRGSTLTQCQWAQTRAGLTSASYSTVQRISEV